MRTARTALAALALLMAAPSPAAVQEARLVPMGTGAVTGVYYPVGVALCRLVNEHRPEHGIRCSARPTEGSVGNVEALRAGALDLAIVQSDVQHAALEGTGAFAEAGALPELRSVMSLHAEPLTVVARADAGIHELQDLAGERVAIGNPGSGTRAIIDALMAELGWTPQTFAAAPELPAARQGAALCQGEIDAFLYVVGHPALAIQEVTTACPATLIEAAGPAVEALVAETPGFRPATIPAGLYRGTAEAVETFGVGATLVTRADVPEEVVYTLVREVFEDLGTLRALHPALAGLEPETMAEAGLSAPLHPGAERYFRERGWLE